MPTIDAGDGPVFYQETGEGRTVILLHSSACSGTQWRDLAARLAGDCRVLVPDLPGYGRSIARPDPHRTGLAADSAVVTALAATANGPVHVIGHSYGGAVALRFAIEGWRRLDSLVLIEPVAFHLLRAAGPDCRQCLNEIEELAGRVREASLAGDAEGAMSHFVDYWNGEGTWQRLAEGQRQALAGSADRVVHDFQATLQVAGGLADCAGLEVPTLLIAGEHSPAPVRRILDLLASTLPSARRRIVEGAGHMLPLTHPDETAQAVLAHLDSHLEHSEPRKSAA